MDTNGVKNLEELVKPLLTNGTKFVGVDIKRLTSIGENYGSLILAVNVKVQNGQNKEDTIHVVAKMLPPNKFLQKLFNTDITFRNEVGFYKIIAPALRQLQKEQDMAKLLDFFPKYYGSRMNLNGNEKIDDNAMLLLENLKISGFVTMDRTVGFDLKTARLILRNLAELHGVGIALKFHRPDVFQRKLVPFFEEFELFDMNDTMKNAILDKIIETVSDDEMCIPVLKQLRELVNVCFVNVTRFPRNSKIFHQGPFLSIVHSDLWVNNIMIKVVEGESVDVRIVDFQLYQWASLARDVLFFLLTSVQIPVLQQHFDDLTLFYHESLCETLKELRCDTGRFSFKAFEEEMELAAKRFEFYHIMVMMEPIFATQESTKEINELTEEDFKEKKEISKAHKERACFIAREFIKRGWI